MHRFLCNPSGKRCPSSYLQGAYLVGTDSVPIRGELSVSGDQICGQTRSQEPVGLSLLWPVEGFGAVQLETTRLPAREEPYHLPTELARHRLMRLMLKREEWGLFDYPGLEETVEQINQARDLFIEAISNSDDPPAATEFANKSLALAMQASEQTCQFHAAVFLSRRRQSGGFPRGVLGVSAPSGPPRPEFIKPTKDTFEFVRVPTTWRQIQTTEQSTDYDNVDAWVKACSAAKLSVRAGPLLNFGVRSVPDWMYIWENDFETIFEMAREHVRRTVQRYAGKVSSWIVASGLHADNVFSMNFEQIMELTRMAANETKQLAPRSQVILDLTQPWGEYYAHNQRTVPPFLYADMAAQSGINFDAFGLQFLFGIGSDGYHLRDLFQVSALIDRLANLGKPLHVTGMGVPSVAKPATGSTSKPNGGEWRSGWSDETHAEWLAALSEVALSKPYVESICLHALVDGASDTIPSCGVLRENLKPKPILKRMAELRRELRSGPSG